jgi:hypothetical protein
MIAHIQATSAFVEPCIQQITYIFSPPAITGLLLQRTFDIK